jgi:hypothetical protein
LLSVFLSENLEQLIKVRRGLEGGYYDHRLGSSADHPKDGYTVQADEGCCKECCFGTAKTCMFFAIFSRQMFNIFAQLHAQFLKVKKIQKTIEGGSIFLKMQFFSKSAIK